MAVAARVGEGAGRVAVRVLSPIAGATVSYRPGDETSFLVETARRYAESGIVKILPSPEESLAKTASELGAGLLLTRPGNKAEELRDKRIRAAAKKAGVRVVVAGRGRSIRDD